MQPPLGSSGWPRSRLGYRPSSRSRGRIIADLVTIAVAAPLMAALDFHVTRPFVMLALLGAALALNHVVPLVMERRLQGSGNDSARAATNVGLTADMRTGDEPYTAGGPARALPSLATVV